ncbi:SMC-Scp complex subunit ScpB [Thermosipho globiformans]|uniref:SMC-Scp complex subunit ScpB n=1 Tax=Thermosipho globiformans TaxID=380685 RepID=UPI000F8F1240|nr:SMC-Scp complex subunit ScpB [Thermosipho globiformans]
MEKEKIALIEAIIFASKGISMQKLNELTNINQDEINKIIEHLYSKYNNNSESGIELKNIDGYLKFYTKKQYSSHIEKVVKRRSLSTLTNQQLEIAILLATKKEATKKEIDGIRGKDSTNILKQLLYSGVIKRKKSGRSYIYSLTETFKEETLIEELIGELGGAQLDTFGSKNSSSQNNGKR